MKLPKRRKDATGHRQSQRQIDRQFAEITSTIDHSDFYTAGPRDYQLAEEPESDLPFQVPVLADRGTWSISGWPAKLGATSLVALLAWLLGAIFLPHLALWYALAGISLLGCTVACLWASLKRGPSQLDDTTDHSGARL